MEEELARLKNVKKGMIEKYIERGGTPSDNENDEGKDDHPSLPADPGNTLDGEVEEITLARQRNSALQFKLPNVA